MELNQDIKNNLMNRVNQVWTNSKVCPICGQQKWSMSDRVFSMHEFHVKPGEQSQMVPFIILICSSCGYSMFFNAISLGLRFEMKKKDNDK